MYLVLRGDKLITEAVATVYNNKKVKTPVSKGLSSPHSLGCSRSSDQAVDTYSPLSFLFSFVLGRSCSFVGAGIAFPTAISVNNTVSHFSPLTSDTGVAALANGDVAKLMLGIHIDGVSLVISLARLFSGGSRDCCRSETCPK